MSQQARWRLANYACSGVAEEQLFLNDHVAAMTAIYGMTATPCGLDRLTAFTGLFLTKAHLTICAAFS